VSAPHPTFLPQHVAYLDARAVPLAFAVTAGLRSVSGVGAAALLGRSKTLPCGGLAIPYPGLEPAYVRVRLDEPMDGVRFLAPSGREVPVYVPDETTACAATVLHVVEGPIKALALAAQGLAAVGLGGTGTTLVAKGEHRSLNRSWERVELEGRLVIVVFDAGRKTNPNVARDEARLVLALEAAGAIVRLAELPAGPRGQDQGPDDYLAAQGADALRAVIAAARPADPVVWAREVLADETTRQADRAASLLDDVPFLLAVLERGPAAEHRIGDLLRSAKVTVKQWNAALTHAKRSRASAQKAGQESPSNFAGAIYEVCAGNLCLIIPAGEAPRVVPLANFEALIQREIVLDDGVDEQRRFEVFGVLADNTPLPPVTVEAAEFSLGRWPLIKWGARAIVSADTGAPAHLRAAIQARSQPTQVRFYRHTGMREVEGRPVFLHADGAIGGRDVLTQLDGRLGQYRFPAEVLDPREALETSLAFLEVGPWEVTVPLLAATYRAPTSSALPVDATVWVVGRSGSTKSTQVALLLGHDGDFDRTRLTANWNDTVASIEDTLFRAKDVVAVIDDFAPKGSESWDSLRGKAETVLRSIGNRSSRGRMRADLTAHSNRPPRGLVIATGEDLPSGESILARLVPVRVTREGTYLDRLARLELRKGRLTHAKAAYVAWLLPHLGALTPWLHERFTERRAHFQGCGGHLRTPEAIAHLAVGLELLAAFAVTLGVFTPDRANGFVRDTVEALREVGVGVGFEVTHADPVVRFMEVLRTLFAQQRVALQTDLKMPLLTGPGCEYIGWIHAQGEGHAYLLPGPTRRVVVEELSRARESMPLSEQTLWERLIERGMLLRGEPGHHTTKRSLGGGRPRVLTMPLWVLDDAEPAGKGPGEGSARGVCDGVAVAPRGEADRDLTPTSQLPASRLEPKDCPACPACPVVEEEILYGERYSLNQGAARGERGAEPPSSPGGGGAGGAPGAPPAADLAAAWFPPFAEPLAGGVQQCVDAEQGPAAPATVAPPIQREFALADLPANLRAASRLAVDVRPLQTGPSGGDAHQLTLEAPDGDAVVLNLAANGGLGALKEVLEGVMIVGHDLRAPLTFLKHHGVEPQSLWDTMLAARLLDGGQHCEAQQREHYFSFEEVARRELGGTGPSDGSEFAEGERRVGTLLRLHARQEGQIVDAGLSDVMALELGVLPVVVAMTLAGVGFDRGRWEALVTSSRAEAATLRSQIEAELGIPNVYVHEALLDALRRAGIPVERADKAHLAPHRHIPVVERLTRFRSVDSFASGIGAGVVAALDRSPDGRVRARFDQLAAPTGRFGCSQPNLLGMPKTREVRECIVPAEGNVFVVADYAAIELRVLAHVTGDAHLTTIFREGGDPHRIMAATLCGKPLEEVTRADRQPAKAVNFGFAFGMGVATFVLTAQAQYGVVMTLSEAEAARATYLRTYPGVAQWQERIRRQPPTRVRSASGRFRLFPDSGEGYCERLNMAVQGTAADGMKLALTLLRPRLLPYGARIVLCVHDEPVVEVPREHAEVVCELVARTMIEGMSRYVTSVPIVVEADVRSTWASSSSISLGGVR
jgi:DNA polymerase I-like protein with 3'-5' exonuclease and polymerase domains